MLAHTESGVRADAVILGKALSGGMYPVSAFLADEPVMSVFDPGSHGSTYGGNPLACAVAEAALDVLIDEDLCTRSRQLGKHFADGIANLHSPLVKEIRARGLWLGVELTREAGPARKVCERLMADGMLCKDTHGHTIRIAPPLVIEKSDVDWAVERLRRALALGA